MINLEFRLQFLLVIAFVITLVIIIVSHEFLFGLLILQILVGFVQYGSSFIKVAFLQKRDRLLLLHFGISTVYLMVLFYLGSSFFDDWSWLSLIGIFIFPWSLAILYWVNVFTKKTIR